MQQHHGVEQADHGAGERCTHTGSGHAESGDQQRIEDDVEDTHGRVQEECSAYSISPQHCRNAELMETSCENGIISEKIKK